MTEMTARDKRCTVALGIVMTVYIDSCSICLGCCGVHARTWDEDDDDYKAVLSLPLFGALGLGSWLCYSYRTSSIGLGVPGLSFKGSCMVPILQALMDWKEEDPWPVLHQDRFHLKISRPSGFWASLRLIV